MNTPTLTEAGTSEYLDTVQLIISSPQNWLVNNQADMYNVGVSQGPTESIIREPVMRLIRPWYSYKKKAVTTNQVCGLVPSFKTEHGLYSVEYSVSAVLATSKYETETTSGRRV